MKSRLTASSFLAHMAHTGTPLLDVRAPAEYQRGHIPGAVSVPLFDDGERAIVGTLYKQESREEALLKGLEIVGPKMAGFVLAAKALAPDKRLLLHCWRGGMRSESMAWLYRTAGFEVAVLEGGYKAYRSQVRADFVRPWPLIVLGGKTGTGKTAILHALREAGEQILDLEDIAHHKGSAFGALGQALQPATEQFENDLHQRLVALDPGRRIWVEDESKAIGRVYIPDPFWEQMRQSPVLMIEMPLEIRVQRLVREYADFSPEALAGALCRIEKRLGGLRLREATAALARGDYATTAEIALAYYDKAYTFGLENKPGSQVRVLHANEDAPATTAALLIEFANPGIVNLKGTIPPL